MIHAIPKHVWLLVAGIIVILLAAIAIFILTKDEEVAIKSVETSRTTNSVEIDFRQYEEKFSVSERTLIDNALARQFEKGEPIDTVARANSYKESVIDDTLVKQLLLDVVAKKKTFLVYKTDGGVNGQNILYVVCAPQEDQLDQTVECKDMYES